MGDMSGDPLRLVWDALEAHGCQPRGKEYQFRARCPGHNGDNRTSLSVGIGADGRAVLWCHAHQCEVETITAALGLQVADLFPDGHHRGHRYPLRRLRRVDFQGAARKVVNVIFALEQLGERWQLMLTCDECPYCGGPGAWLRAKNDHVDVDCPAGCDPQAFTNGLLGRLHEKEAGNRE
jgi:hypothetical protein